MKYHFFLAGLLLVHTLLFGQAFPKADEIVRINHASGISAIPIIFETDMGNDIDDALALDMLYKYADMGLVNLLGISSNKDTPHSIEFLDLMNTWYGYPDLPMGKVVNGFKESPNDYTQKTCLYQEDGKSPFKRTHQDYGKIPEATRFYRELLSKQPDNSVVVVSVGFSTNIARLLDTQPDQFSPLTGKELVAQKVKYLSMMAGNATDSTDSEWNIRKDIPAGQKVFNEWPAPIVISPVELGFSILFPATAIENGLAFANPHPLKIAYERFRKMPYDRPTWDLTSVLYAVEGAEDYFTVSERGRMVANDKGQTRFYPDENGKHVYLSVNSEQIENVRNRFIELVTTKPKNLHGQWDPKAEADKALNRIVKVTATDDIVKGAHCADMVLTGNHAYIVYMANDVRAGEHPEWHELYAAMSIVNLETLQVEAIIPFVHSEQSFDNERLLPGAIMGERILQKDERTLRCWFESTDPGVRQSQVYFIDFDIPSRTFSKTIHRMLIKTSGGAFPMQPFYFYQDAWNHGLRKKPADFGICLADSFKEIDGKIYVNVHNFPGMHNALGVMNNTLDTVEIVGHFFEPQKLNLSEVAFNRLPDGTWMAIIRQNGGNRNYAFAFSADGKTWEPAKFMDFVPNGTSSAAIFERFNGVYYLGWQESTRINNVTRSVFNIDVSTDGKTWERKYRFETEKSFQYPAFRLHNGRIWLAVTQGDTSTSRKEYIMFGVLE